jgi:hypothetical protein
VIGSEHLEMAAHVELPSERTRSARVLLLHPTREQRAGVALKRLSVFLPAAAVFAASVPGAEPAAVVKDRVTNETPFAGSAQQRRRRDPHGSVRRRAVRPQLRGDAPPVRHHRRHGDDGARDVGASSTRKR